MSDEDIQNILTKKDPPQDETGSFPSGTARKDTSDDIKDSSPSTAIAELPKKKASHSTRGRPDEAMDERMQPSTQRQEVDPDLADHRAASAAGPKATKQLQIAAPGTPPPPRSDDSLPVQVDSSSAATERTGKKLQIAPGTSPPPRLDDPVARPAPSTRTTRDEIFAYFGAASVDESGSQETSIASTQVRPGAYHVPGIDEGNDDQTAATPWPRDEAASQPQADPEVIARPVRASMPSASIAVPFKMSRRKATFLLAAAILIAVGLLVGLILGLKGGPRDRKLVTSSPTFAPSVSPTSSPAPSPSPTQMPTVAPSPYPTQSPAPTDSPAPSPSPTQSPAPTDSPAPSPSPTQSPAPSLSPIPANWTQLGRDLVGEASDDRFASSIAMSADGNIVAVGAPFNDYNDASTDSDRGSVHVFIRNGTLWNQLGGVLRGENEYDWFGNSVTLSTDGTLLAVGAPQYYTGEGDPLPGYVRAFQLVNDDWAQVGPNLNGENAGDWFGWSVALSAEGTVLAVGADQYTDEGLLPGYVRVFRLVNDEWLPVGSNLNGENAGDQFGTSVALSADGTVLAAGASQSYTDEGLLPGYVRVFQLVNNGWLQVGSNLNGENPDDVFGWSVALSADGTVLAVGAPWNDDNGEYSGQVRIFRLVNDDWSQVGSNLNGENEFDFFGTSVALSSDGTVLAVGARYNDDNGRDSGQVRVFQLVNDDDWAQVGSAINGKDSYDYFGVSVALSADGKTVAGGADQLGNGGPGYVLVHRLEEEDE